MTYHDDDEDDGDIIVFTISMVALNATMLIVKTIDESIVLQRMKGENLMTEKLLKKLNSR